MLKMQAVLSNPMSDIPVCYYRIKVLSATQQHLKNYNLNSTSQIEMNCYWLIFSSFVQKNSLNGTCMTVRLFPSWTFVPETCWELTIVKISESNACCVKYFPRWIMPQLISNRAIARSFFFSLKNHCYTCVPIVDIGLSSK